MPTITITSTITITLAIAIAITVTITIIIMKCYESSHCEVPFQGIQRIQRENLLSMSGLFRFENAL